MFLPGESHGQRSLAGYSLQGHKELDMTERLCMHVACDAITYANSHAIILPPYTQLWNLKSNKSGCLGVRKGVRKTEGLVHGTDSGQYNEG